MVDPTQNNAIADDEMSADQLADSVLAGQDDSDAPLSDDTPSDSSGDAELEKSNKLAENLNSLQSLIERRADALDKLKIKQKELRESLKNIFENDAKLTEAQQQADELTTQLKERKQSLDNTPEVRKLKMGLTDVKEEMNEVEDTLNNDLISLFQMTGSMSFDTSDGDQREYVIKARVKPKTKKAA